MQALLQAMAALLLVAAAAYAQLRIPAFTRGGPKIWVTRLLLLLAGSAFGVFWGSGLDGRWSQLLGFVTGFGMVHVPAAALLFIKGKRGAGRT